MPFMPRGAGLEKVPVFCQQQVSERKLICFLVKTRFRLERPNSSRRRSRRRVIKNARDGNAAREKKSEGLPPPANDVSWRNGENFRERERERERKLPFVSCIPARNEYTSRVYFGGSNWGELGAKKVILEPAKCY